MFAFYNNFEFGIMDHHNKDLSCYKFLYPKEQWNKWDDQINQKPECNK